MYNLTLHGKPIRVPLKKIELMPCKLGKGGYNLRMTFLNGEVRDNLISNTYQKAREETKVFEILFEENDDKIHELEICREQFFGGGE